MALFSTEFTQRVISRTFTRFGVVTPAERLARFLRDTPPSDPRRQRIEQLLQTARERRKREQNGQ